ncbi:hypothetical protein CHS0354_038020 [Potamilus streckersoni]|uniref:Sulfotransferase domain-containing protein n=1 Tax=Potamilus streckersoni TaxID=2493646 RepID=A0AAE0W1C3_9BIVA|nr:hypothetical protein CHS0354_038020 [Potamilus streckersoni]
MDSEAQETRSSDLPDLQLREKVYKGIRMSENEIEEIEVMDIRSDDIWVASHPRSGTTVTQEMTYLIVTEDFESAKKVQLDDRFPIIEVKDDRFPFYRGLKYLEKMQKTRFIKTHLPYFLLPKQIHQAQGRVIYVARNPKDSCISLYRFLRYFKWCDNSVTFEMFFERFMKGDVFAGSWWNHVREYWEHRDDTNVLFIKYDDIIEDKTTVIRQIADFLGKKNISDELVEEISNHCSFQNMKENKAVNFSYAESIKQTDTTTFTGLIDTGQIGGRREVYTEEMLKRMDDKFQRKLGGTGLTFS